MTPDESDDMRQSSNCRSISVPVSPDEIQNLRECAAVVRINNRSQSALRCTSAVISFALLIVCCGFFALRADGDGIVLEQEMEVTIPDGFVSGQKLTVQVPGFGKAILAVPPDSVPGETVKFRVPQLPQELNKHQTTALRRSKEVRMTKPLTYSITIPKNSGSEIIANVPGVGQVGRDHFLKPRFETIRYHKTTDLLRALKG
jgi:hypothetical protein